MRASLVVNCQSALGPTRFGLNPSPIPQCRPLWVINRKLVLLGKHTEEVLVDSLDLNVAVVAELRRYGIV
jgi:hypothetical protein